jgi:hypothetical protein
MSNSPTNFPFFIPVETRKLTEIELKTVERMVSAQSVDFRNQVSKLRVVGRCGCGVCPTIFFLEHQFGDSEYDVCMFSGNDRFGGLVGVALMEKQGKLSQLEYFSIDGSNPWEPPNPEQLQIYT